MKSYSKASVANEPRTELHDLLGLTGAEISINHLPAGVGVPFVHAHKNNEEIYIIQSGDIVRISPNGKRQFFAAKDSELSYVCIQVKEGSIEGYTANDAIIYGQSKKKAL